MIPSAALRWQCGTSYINGVSINAQIYQKPDPSFTKRYSDL